MLSRCSPLWQSSTFASFSALVIVLHLPKVGLLAICSIVTCPFSSLWFLLLQAHTFSNKVSFPMGIFALYTMFTIYAAPLASPVIPHPFLFVLAILLFTGCRPPLQTGDGWRFMSCCKIKPMLDRLAFFEDSHWPWWMFPTVSAPKHDLYNPLWRPSNCGSDVCHLDNDLKYAKACKRSCGR